MVFPKWRGTQKRDGGYFMAQQASIRINWWLSVGMLDYQDASCQIIEPWFTPFVVRNSAEIASSHCSYFYYIYKKVYWYSETTCRPPNVIVWIYAGVERHAGRIIFLTYQSPAPVQETLLLVGKGVTYDTGGANIKTGGYMTSMSRDKGGAAAVAGFMKVTHYLSWKFKLIICYTIWIVHAMKTILKVN